MSIARHGGKWKVVVARGPGRVVWVEPGLELAEATSASGVRPALGALSVGGAGALLG